MNLGETLQPWISLGIQPQTHQSELHRVQVLGLWGDEQMIHPGRGEKCLVVEKGRWRKKCSFLEGGFYFHWLD